MKRTAHHKGTRLPQIFGHKHETVYTARLDGKYRLAYRFDDGQLEIFAIAARGDKKYYRHE